jgi:hypothetical protein
MRNEVAVRPFELRWRKSSHSGAETNCVEVARAAVGDIRVRDSKNPEGPKLAFTSASWRSFTGQVKGGACNNRS